MIWSRRHQSMRQRRESSPAERVEAAGVDQPPSPYRDDDTAAAAKRLLDPHGVT